METDGLLRLVITAKGQGGVRVLLKPAETPRIVYTFYFNIFLSKLT